MAAVTPQGLAGRVIGSAAQRPILLITDLNSRSPWLVERSRATRSSRRQRAGTGAALPADDAPPRRGRPCADLGDGGLLPPGLSVGRVSAVGEQGAKVRPFIDWSRLDYVSVLLYDGLPPPEAGEGGAAGAPVAATADGAPGGPGGARVSAPASARSATSWAGSCRRRRRCSRSWSTCCRCRTARRTSWPRR